MLGVSGLIMGDGAAAAVAESGGSSEVGSAAGGGLEELERSGGGNRWPRQETLALLKIRSDMDVAFRDASLKGPLWEDVSRKMGELGFQRSAKKCKEKFENVYKYHKRTKDGRASKPDGKSYRFFDQLAALENTPPPPPPRPQPPPVATTITAPPPPLSIPMPTSHVTVSSTSPTPLSVVPPKIVTNPINNSPFKPSQPPLIHPPLNASAPPPPPPPQSHNFQLSHRSVSMSPASNSTSSSTSSDEDIQRRRGRKRKWKDYFERLMKDVVQKQEELQKKFLETLEKRERDRIAREEAWRVQEMAKMNREHDRLVQERSIAAAKDAAVVAFLQKVTGEQTLQIPLINNNATQQQTPMQIQAAPENNSNPPQPQPPPPPSLDPPAQAMVVTTPNRDNGGDDVITGSSSRWPKAEVEALINLRTGLEVKYQDNGPKGPLWEEISKSMAKLGYSRNAKRCKEKWENINKYFKKVKESNKKRPEDAKTCPYFHQLDAIYRERARNNSHPMAPIMARPEQQWPQADPALHEREHDNESREDDEDDDDEDDVGGYEIIANNKQPSSLTNTVE